MFNLTSKRAVDLAKFISTLPAEKSEVNMKDIFSRYTNDVTALCCYGIKVDSIRDPTNKILTCGKKITHKSTIHNRKYILNRTFPKLGGVYKTSV